MKALPHLFEYPEIYIKKFLHRDEDDRKIRKVAFE